MAGPLPRAADETALRADILDALRRVGRDEDERGEPALPPQSDEELLDSIWGRIPVEHRRLLARAEFDRFALRYLAEVADDLDW